MKVSYDLRFAHLPCGSWPYVSQVIGIMVRQHPQTQWRIYHNPQSPPQQEIVHLLQSQYPPAHNPDRISYQPVKNYCLSPGHHLEFLRFHDDADVYHYLHFDLPLGMRHIPLVMTIHDLYPLVLPGYCSNLKKQIFRFICRQNARRAARVITISQTTKKDIIEHLDIPENKIVVIPQGYSREYHPIDDTDKLHRIRLKYQLPAQFILYAGNHKAHKNLHRLLQSYAQLPTQLKENFPLVLTGPITADTQKLRELAHKLKIERQVKFIGLIRVEDLPCLFNLAGLVVLASLYEGFGLPPLEAMACGTPVICSQTGALPEVVGSAARLFNPYDIEAITSTMTAALENDIDNPALKQLCLRQAAQFGWDKTAQKTYQVYQTVAGG